MTDDLDAQMAIVERLTRLFLFERIVYLIISFLAALLLMYIGYLMVSRGEASAAELTLLFGSTGIIGFTTSRLIFMWNEALRRLLPMERESS